MEISSRIDGDVTILGISGRLDLSSANELKAAAHEIVNKGDCRLILDMSQVEFINSSGLGALVSLLKDVRMNNGRLKLVNLAPFVKEIFEITQLNNIFDICGDEKRARRSFHEALVN
jgi:anti-sigma B factor antagonist